jgi:two-component system CheB/CheR fusion protein
MSGKPEDKKRPNVSKTPPPPARFPIVGIGASAGGLEAFTQLLGALPKDTGMGFVLVPHLDPDHESQLVPILSRATALSVREIRNDEHVLPNHVYIIPRDRNLTVVDGVLKIQPRKRERTLHRSIDAFFESLAEDRREWAVGVVLSGTGSDGTLGLEAIKAEGGITFAQDDTAKHNSMPRSAVAAGCVDLVLPPVEIADELARIARHPFVAGQKRVLEALDGETRAEATRSSAAAHEDDATPLPSGDKGSPRTGARRARTEAAVRAQEAEIKGDHDGYRKILLLLRNHSGVDFSLYKSTTIQRRITRRLVLSRHNTLDEYAAFLRGNTAELDALYSDVLISVTSFFRNPDAFEILQERIFPELLKHPGTDSFRCWVLGCSTGQEAYSIAIAFAEVAEKAARMRRLQIFATDLNEALLEKARYGLYAKSLAEDISPERLRRFFVEEEGGYRISKGLRETVVFARQNLIADPPFSRLDLVSCRNLLIYLEPAVQKKAIPMFHYALKPGGFLLLGASESVGGFTDLFESIDKKHKIYAKKAAPQQPLPLPVRKDGDEPITGPRPLVPLVPPPGPDLGEGARTELDAQREADRITVSQLAPPSVLVSADLQVLQFRGPTGAFLEPPQGRASFDVLKMAREGLMLPLRATINQARKEDKTARKQGVRIKRDGRTRTIDLEVIPLRNLRQRAFLILFKEPEKRGYTTPATPEPPAPGRRGRAADRVDANRIAELEAEIFEMREYLQSMQEQHEASIEEVQSANEEVQSANEELQSVNEELETSKEELESTNEELTTVNDEMSTRNNELNRLNNDLINLQSSTRLPILLLGRDLTIRRFSPQAEKQFDLVAHDVGRPLSHIRHGLLQTDGSPLDLEALVTEVITDLREQEREVQDRQGRWHSLRVRPYMTLEAKLDGAVVVMVGIDKLMRAERAVRESEELYRTLVEQVQDYAIFRTDPQGRATTWNEGVRRVLGFEREEFIGQDVTRAIFTLDDVKSGVAQDDLDTAGRTGTAVNDRWMRRKNGERLFVNGVTTALRDQAGNVVGFTKVMRDDTERVHGENVAAQLASIVMSSDDAIISKDLKGIIQTWNRGAERLFGYSTEEAIGKSVTLIIPPDRQDEEPRILDRLRRGESVDHYETVRQHKDGSLLDISLTVSPVRDAGGKIIGAAKIARDIGERKRNEKQLLQSTTDLANVAQRKNEFLAMLGHELRNPLSALALNLEVLGRIEGDSARSADVRGRIMRQARRMGSLLDQLLDIARITSGKIEITKQPVDLAEVVQSAVESVRPLIDAQKHKLSVTVPVHQRAFVMGDAARLTQVIDNLLTNAAKYTNEEGQISLALEINDHRARITVRDNGIGMTAELLPHIFEVFTQAPRSLDRAKGGLGLGLPLVQRVVELHGGRVEASSGGPGQGSQFVVTLPRGFEHRVDHFDREGPIDTDGIEPRRILVVDDEQDGGEGLASLLESYGHETRVVKDGPAALEAAHDFVPEVVLLDIGLPEMDGYVVAQKLRELLVGKKVLLIAITGYQIDPARVKLAGFDEYLMKPPNMRALNAMLAGEGDEQQ